MSTSPKPHSLHELHLTRATHATEQACAQPSALIEYQLHLPSKEVGKCGLNWPALETPLRALARAPRLETALGVGRTLREALLRSRWESAERDLIDTLTHGPATLLIRLNAYELYGLPWEAMPLGETGPPLAEVPNLRVLYDPPSAEMSLMPVAPPRAPLLVWSARGGGVPHAEVAQALGATVTEMRDPSLARLAEALGEQKHDALVLLAHGTSSAGNSILLRWGDEDITPAQLVAALRPLPMLPRRVLVLACQGGAEPIDTLGYGGFGLALHRLGVPSVLASRWNLSRRGAILLARGLNSDDPRASLSPGEVDRLGVVAFGCGVFGEGTVRRRLGGETPLGHAQPPTVTAAPLPAAALAKFVGRAEQLADLAAALLPPSGKAQAAVVCNLQGMAGVGKSFLVERFVQLNGDRFIGGYKKIPLGDAEQPTAQSLLQSIAERLGLKPSPDDLLARVQMALEHRPHLLHIDNLDTPAQAQAAAELVERLPSTPLILTGRHTFVDAGGWRVVPVAPFAVDEALQQLNHELGEGRAMAEPEADKRALVTELGGLPLAISLAGSYLHGGRSIRTFLERYRQKLLDIEPYHPNSKSYQDSTRKALRSLAATFNLSIDALRERLGADADAGLPALCALGVAPLVGARIGWIAAIMGVGETQAEDWLDKALTLSIVQHDPETRRWRVHKLLGEHLRSLTDAGTAIARMDQWVAERLVNEPMQSRGARWESLYTELEGVTEWVTGLNGARVIGGAIVGLEYALAKGPYDVWLSAAQRGLCETTDGRLKVKLLGGVGRLAKGAGNYELALQCSEKWTAYANAYGWDEEIAQARRFGAGVLHMTGQLEDVLRILRDEVLPVLDKLSHERETADLRLEIADILIARRRLNEAQDICDHDVMPVYVRLDDKRRSANLMSRIASIHHARGQYSQALQIRMHEVLPVYQERSDNLETAKTLGWMALELQHLGEHGKALTILTDSVVPTFSQLGDLNGKCVAQGQIADVYYQMGEHNSALQMLIEEILPICKRLGDIRGAAITMGKIARIQKSNGAFVDALRTLREEIMPIFKRLRDDHSRAITMSDIAEVFIARGQLNRALCIETKLVSVYTKLAAHSETIYTLGKISDIYQARMQYNEALRWRREAAQITRTLGNPRHTIVQEGKLAITLLLTRKLKHRDEARSLLTTALKSAEDLDFPNEAKQIRSVFPRFNLRLPT